MLPVWPILSLLDELLELVPLIVRQNRLELLSCLLANFGILGLRPTPYFHQLLPGVGKDPIYLLLLLVVEIKTL
jgi:hypothetical protein